MQPYTTITQKRKAQAIVIAIAIIATLILQLFYPLTVRAENNREISIYTSYSVTSEDPVMTKRQNVTISGAGHFVGSSFKYETDKDFSARMFVISDKIFYRTYLEYTIDGKGSINNDQQVATYYNGLYYLSVSDFGVNYSSSGDKDLKVSTNGLVNLTSCTDKDFFTILQKRIDSNYYDLSKDDYKEITFDSSTAKYSSDIPTPKITVDNQYNLSFNNSTDDYYFQLKGRWYSVDDIELYKESAQWKYKYNSIIKSGLSEWTEKSVKTNTADLNLATIGKSAFDSFLSGHPIDSRSFTGGTNALGNYFSGYNDAVNTMKMLLNQPTSLYNGVEIYVRYYIFDSDGVAHYGKWCHYYDNLANADGSSGSQLDDKDNMFMGNQSDKGLSDDQLNDVENTGNSTKADTDLKPDYNGTGSGSYVIGDSDLSNLTTTLKSLYSQGQEIINMFGQVFSFLPSWLTALICTSIGLVCLIGIVKALKG